MWMAELSERSGTPVATIKYYRREGLLPAGEAVSATRASYGERHVDRLRLIRALVDVAGMPLDRVREVLAVVDDESLPVAAAIGSAHTALSPEPLVEPSVEATHRVAALIVRRRWRTDPAGRHARALASALDAMAAAGVPMRDSTLATYADGADTVAAVDVEGVVELGPQRATERAVTGTLLGEPVLIALRRMAHENLARRRLTR